MITGVSSRSFNLASVVEVSMNGLGSSEIVKEVSRDFLGFDGPANVVSESSLAFRLPRLAVDAVEDATTVSSLSWVPTGARFSHAWKDN